MRIKKSTFIEKFKGDFNKVDGGCTVIHTKSAQLIKNPFNLGIYTYLASKPETWNVNPKELSTHFEVGIKKIYKALSDLIMIGLMERKEYREKGRFVDYEYYLYLSPNGQNGVSDNSPNGQKPLGGEPNGQNGCTYKEEILTLERIEEEKDLSLTQTSKTPRSKTFLTDMLKTQDQPLNPCYQEKGQLPIGIALPHQVLLANNS